MSMVAAHAATAACPGRFWGPGEGIPERIAPSPPRHFTFEPLPVPGGVCKPRRRQRRVLYPPAVRRPLPTDEPSSAAKRLLLLLLAVVGAQIYTAPDDVIADVTVVAVTSSPIPEATPIPAGNSGIVGISNGTTPGAARGGFCPSSLAPVVN